MRLEDYLYRKVCLVANTQQEETNELLVGVPTAHFRIKIKVQVRRRSSALL